jgi:GNAT superfamily N-acetyltransferase
MYSGIKREELSQMVEIIVAPEDRRDEIWTLFLEYCDDLSQYDGEKRPQTRKRYPYFDRYWENTDCVPFLVTYHSEPIGFCLMCDTGVSYRVDEFYIRPLQRRRGFGKLVVDFVKEYCRKLGRHDVMAANVYVNNDPAIRFWQSAGFRDTGRRMRIKNLRMIETEADLEEAGQP